MLCDNQQPAHSYADEFCASVGELKPGDQIFVLGGGAVLRVLEATHDTETATTTLRIHAVPSCPVPPARPHRRERSGRAQEGRAA